ncbi:MAG: aminotransferase class III-fold pyridoxal phosphate-dependent enzyme [Candidatus Eisenbacteria bacterium]|nr:aminotransferase class III-fold pyridoxal phosphate-dependent enzyme [Candidatus Latescibacterota bacterium]MBD3302132.1 aminotransferase class III-fold pyridoxal phosphate-dependent enzyme [Candidatus Eisenbacteria bacterium]
MLKELQEYGGERQTPGLSAETLLRFYDTDERLREAIRKAIDAHRALREEFGELLRRDEAELCAELQTGYVNFYPDEALNPYVAIGASGPWIVTTHGAVLHDSGGYGMLGLGHAPPELVVALGHTWVMANVMSPHFSQKRLADRLKKEIGHTRGSCPFSQFICMNSGSESISVASRISDLNAGKLTASGGRHAGKKIKQLALEEGFHGRTYRAAMVSHSTIPTYEEHLASFRDHDTLVVVPPNDRKALEEAFATADRENVFFEAMYMEPVMGEGEPGVAIEREFYDRARELTRERETLLIVDSIQAALRAQGCLSIVDYPGFEGCDPPDCETYSKALNAGQYPLSVLALNERTAEIYVPGVYGNTMTTNPRALEVGCAVLDSLTDSLRKNIRDRGIELRTKLEALADEFSGAIRKVTGTGLIVCVDLDPNQYTVVGEGGMEQFLRRNGIGMIHGGKNGVRFTPHFAIRSAEVDLIVETVRAGLRELRRK